MAKENNNGRPPELTGEMRAEALARALESRRAMAAAKAELKSGMIDPAGAVAAPTGPIARVRLYAFLTSCPGIGPAGARRVIRELGLSERRRLSGLGARQRARLARVVAAVAQGRALSAALRAADEA